VHGVSAYSDARTLGPLQIWEGVVARAVHGDWVSLTLIELDPGAHVPEHRHENEQLGILVEGALAFVIGGEARELGPGETWRIPGGVPHSVTAGPAGAVAVEVFAPPRQDWDAIPVGEARPGRWP
jgi:unsaturated pyranuronate lyase